MNTNTNTTNTVKRVFGVIMLILGPISIYFGVHLAHRWYGGYDFDGTSLGLLLAGIVWLIGGIVYLIQTSKEKPNGSDASSPAGTPPVHTNPTTYTNPAPKTTPAAGSAKTASAGTAKTVSAGTAAASSAAAFSAAAAHTTAARTAAPSAAAPTTAARTTTTRTAAARKSSGPAMPNFAKAPDLTDSPFREAAGPVRTAAKAVEPLPAAGSAAASKEIFCTCCGGKLRVPADKHNILIRCPKCGGEFKLF